MMRAAAACVWLLPPLLGVAAVLYATSSGIGLMTDSAAYIGTARGLLAGAGVAHRTPQGTMQPLTFYAPLLPLTIAAIARLGMSPFAAARLVNSVAIGLTIALAMVLIRADSGSRRWALLGGTLLAVSPAVLMPHSIVLTEPLFFVFSLAAIGCLARYSSTGARAALVAAAILCGVGGLARYAGAELVVAGTIVVLLRGWRRGAHTGYDAALFAALSAALPLAWMVRNRIVAGELPRQLGWHPVPLSQWRRGLGTLASFLGLSGSWASRVLGVGGVALLVYSAHSRRPLTAMIADLTPVASTALAFAAVHIVFLIAATTFIDVSLTFDPRLLAPAYVWGAVGVICALARSSANANWTARQRAALASAVGAIAISHLLNSVPWMIDAHYNGEGYTRREWTQAPIMEHIKRLPADAAVYSDGAPLIDLLLDRTVHRLPEHTLPLTNQPNPLYELELEHMRARLAGSNGLVVYFSQLTWVWNVVGANELQRRFGLRELYRGSDGAIYGWPASVAPQAPDVSAHPPRGDGAGN